MSDGKLIGATSPKQSLDSLVRVEADGAAHPRGPSPPRLRNRSAHHLARLTKSASDAGIWKIGNRGTVCVGLMCSIYRRALVPHNISRLPESRGGLDLWMYKLPVFPFSISAPSLVQDS